MKKATLIIMVVMYCCSCAPDHEKPVQQEGAHVYITDSLASQVNTPIPDSNKKQPDSLK